MSNILFRYRPIYKGSRRFTIIPSSPQRPVHQHMRLLSSVFSQNDNQAAYFV